MVEFPWHEFGLTNVVSIHKSIWCYRNAAETRPLLLLWSSSSPHTSILMGEIGDKSQCTQSFFRGLSSVLSVVEFKMLKFYPNFSTKLFATFTNKTLSKISLAEKTGNVDPQRKLKTLWKFTSDLTGIFNYPRHSECTC